MSDVKSVVSVPNLSPEQLEKMKGMAQKYNDISSLDKLPVIKLINDDEDSKYGKGAFVLGQVKDKNNKITDEGHKIDQVVILTTGYAFSLLDKDNSANNCRSRVVKDKACAVGNRLKVKCLGCEMFKNKTAITRCKMQIVMYVLAVVTHPDGKLEKVPAVMYVKGSRFMDAIEFSSTLSFVDYDGKKYPTPIFSWVVKMESVRVSNEKGQKFFKINWSKKDFLTNETGLEKLAKHADDINDFIAKSDSVLPMDDEDVKEAVDFSHQSAPTAVVAKKPDISTSNVFDDENF